MKIQWMRNLLPAFLLIAGSTWGLAGKQSNAQASPPPEQTTPAGENAAGRDDLAVVEGLIRQGEWERAGKIVAEALRKHSDNPEAWRWRDEMRIVVKGPAVCVHASGGCRGEYQLRKSWLSFRPETESEKGGIRLDLPLEKIRAEIKKDTEWSLNQFGSYGKVQTSLSVQVQPDRHYRLIATVPDDMYFLRSRIILLQYKQSHLANATPKDCPPAAAPTDPAAAKASLPVLVQTGRWAEVDEALACLRTAAPNDPELQRWEAESQVLEHWRLMAYYTWGDFYIRKNWVTFVADEYVDEKHKKIMDRSFHVPITALKKARLTYFIVYGAKSGTGGLLDLVPGWANEIATEKWWGFELDFQPPSGGPSIKLQAHIEEASPRTKQQAEADLKRIKDLAGMR